MRMPIKAAAVMAATTVLLAPAAAMAASTSVTDGKGDTFAITYDNQGNETVKKSDVTNNVDITKTVVKLGKTVQITMHFDKLSKKGVDFYPGAVLETNKSAQTKADDNPYMQGVVSNDQGTWKDTGFLITGAQSGRHLSRAASCDTLKTDVNWKTSVFTMSAPSSCLGAGVKWIKVHAINYGTSYDQSTDTTVSYLDNAHNSKSNDKGWTDKVTKG